MNPLTSCTDSHVSILPLPLAVRAQPQRWRQSLALKSVRTTELEGLAELLSSYGALEPHWNRVTCHWNRVTVGVKCVLDKQEQNRDI